ncbi:MAG: cytochrome c peroxidase [Bacteroidota bacterium]
MKRIFNILFLIVLVAGCKKPVEDPVYTPTPYDLQLPAGFPEMTLQEDNPLTEESVVLGRMLYYDEKLHKDGDQACATCHVQQHAFTSDPDVLPHINLAWSRIYLWDGKISGTMEEIMLFEVEKFFETNVDVFNADEDYKKLFKQAYGVDEITSKEIAYALSQFFRIMISGNSKFDKFLRDEAEFTNQEYLGYELFYTERGDCFHCHASVFMTDNLMHNNALDSLPDPGYFKITSDSLDYGRFKSPTLRNIEYTAPYMHDGRYATLEEVVDFYSHDLQKSPTVDPLMKNLSKGGVQLNEEEKAALIAFLKTLSDPGFLTNPELADPFK